MFEIELKRDGKENLYTQIYEAIRAEILADKYTPDTKMPSIRKLASRLSVNAETVVKAYDLLAAENLIYKKEGSGSYIAPAASKSSGDDQRLRILTSKKFSAPENIIDFSGPENAGEFLEEYSWDLIFDRFYSELEGMIFKRNETDECSYFELLQEQHQEIEKTKLYYSSEKQLQEILATLIGENKELLFTKANNNFLFTSLYSEVFKSANKKRSKASKLGKKINFNLSSSDYDSLMKYLEDNAIDYLIISDESVEESILDWSISKLKSLLELAQMLKFKVIILEYFELYQTNHKIQKLLQSKYKDKIILIQALTARVFPGLQTGLIYLEEKSNENDLEQNLLYKKYSLDKIINERKFSAGENLVNNLLSYYLDNNYFEKRIKFLKQRLKNRKVLLKEAIKDHFRGIEAVESASIFYLKLKLNQKINQHDFKVFAEKNSILLPNYKNFLSAEESNELIISVSALNQFSIKQGVMALAKIYWQFIS